MYHVSKDLRTRKSAKLICQGLEKCLEEKPLDKIRISDIYEKSFVSRSTFYRLFDDVTDVLAYECDRIFAERIKLVESKRFADKKERALYCIDVWLGHPGLMRALTENDLGRILYSTHEKNAEALKKIYDVPFQDEMRSAYFISLLSSLICGAISAYFKRGGKESVEEVYETVCTCTDAISKAFAG